MTRLSRRPVLFDHVGALLADHDDGRVGVAADYGRHDGRVHHPEPVDSVHPEPRIHHRCLVPLGTHLGGTNRMVNGHRVVSDHAFPVGVRIPRYGGATGERYVVQPAAVPAERCGPGHGHHELDALHQRVHVLLDGQVVGQDPGIHRRVGAPQQYFASALGPQQHLRKRQNELIKWFYPYSTGSRRRRA